MNAYLDYETRSRADLKSVGAYRYACDPTTEILMAGVSHDQTEEVSLWVNPKYETAEMMSEVGEPDPAMVPGPFVAHNAPFEAAIYWGKRIRIDREPVRTDFWRCTAAMARRAGLPWSLEKCAEALGLDQQKNTDGKKLIKLFSMPQANGEFIDPKTRPEEWYQFGEYCKQDVRTEKAIHKKLKAFELSGDVLETFLFDLRMNLRGIPVNVTALQNAQAILRTVQKEVTERFRKLTNLNPTQRKAIFELLQSKGVPLLAMGANDIDWAKEYCAKKVITGDVREILELYSKLSFAAVKKIETMLGSVCFDGRVRGTFLYYGAGTGRWTASGMQPQNFKKTPAWMRPITEEVYARISKGTDAETLDTLYGDPVELISGCIRHFIQQPGKLMLDGDYNAIEARIICWLSGQTDILEMWKEGKDLYKFMASAVYGIAESGIDSDKREFGKRVELACSYQMGPDKFLSTCKTYGVECDAELAEKGVSIYRAKHPKVVRYWYYLDAQARAAIAAPGQVCGPFTVRTLAGMPYLLFKLRSGRSIAYPRPLIEILPGDDRTQVTYWGQLPMSVLWGRIKLYGGKLAENETQATAADIMAYGAIQAEKRGMAPFALIHDQALAIRENNETADAFASALATVPPWAKGLPLKVEAKITPYYKK